MLHVHILHLDVTVSRKVNRIQYGLYNVLVCIELLCLYLFGFAE